LRVPKAIRKPSAIAAFFENPLAREMLAVALLAGAAAAAAALRNNPTVRRGVSRTGEAITSAASGASETAATTADFVEHAVGAVGEVVTDALGKAAGRILPEFLGGESNRERAAALSTEQRGARRSPRTTRKPRTSGADASTSRKLPAAAKLGARRGRGAGRSDEG
jgi:L-alanine-DL-glutamate epimerase-like enolase superfamily enzyme